MMRSRMQILSDHPKLYRNNDTTPRSEWIHLENKEATDRLWTSMDEAGHINLIVALPGRTHNFGGGGCYLRPRPSRATG